MATKLFQGAPFGTQTARFDVSAVHPQSKFPGTFTQVPYCKKSTDELQKRLGPGAYQVAVGGFNEDAVFERACGPGWKRSYETTRLAKIPHLFYREQWEKNREQKRKLGPGTYNVNENDFINVIESKPSSVRGICATKEQRFRQGNFTSEVPGPGTYGKGGIPAALKEEREEKSASTVGLLDAGSSRQRSLPTVGCELAPGRYEKMSFTEQILNKVVSKRGPYDSFTGERGNVSKTGHFAVLKHSDLGPGEYRLPSFLDRWNDEHKRKHGQLSKVTQYLDRPTERIYCCTLPQCPKPHSHPAPGTYSPKSPKGVGGRNLPPFRSSAERFDSRANKFFTGNTNPVGAGRYDVQRWNQAQHRYGICHTFNSTDKRFYSHEVDVYMKERVRSKNMPIPDRRFLVKPDNSVIPPKTA